MRLDHLVAFFQIKSQLKRGKHQSVKKYIKILSQLLYEFILFIFLKLQVKFDIYISRKNLRINDKNSDHMILLLPTLADDLHTDLTSHLDLIYPDEIKTTDMYSSSNLHFLWR